MNSDSHHSTSEGELIHAGRGVCLAVVIFMTVMVCPLMAQDRVDLDIQSVSIQPPRPDADTPFSAIAVIRNNGSASVSDFNVTVTITQDRKKIRVIEDIPALSTLPRFGSGLSVPVSANPFTESAHRLRTEH